MNLEIDTDRGLKTVPFKKSSFLVFEMFGHQKDKHKINTPASFFCATTERILIQQQLYAVSEFNNNKIPMMP